MNKQDIQLAFVNSLKAMDEMKSQEEANKEKVKEVFDIISSKIKEYANRKHEQEPDEEFNRQLGMTDEEWDEWWNTEYDIAELNKIQKQ